MGRSGGGVRATCGLTLPFLLCPPFLLQHQCLPVPCCCDAQPATAGRDGGVQTVSRAVWTDWTDPQDHLTTTAILPVQEKRARDRRAAEISACLSSSDICRTEATAKMVPINCEYIPHTHTQSSVLFNHIAWSVEVLRYKNLSLVPRRTPD